MSSCETARVCSTPAPSFTTSRPSSPRRWRTPRSAPDRRTPTPSTTPTANCSTASKTYRLHVDPDPPAKNFWAVDVYDTQTRSLIQVAIHDLPRAGQQLRDAAGQRRRLLRPVLRTRRRPTARRRTGSRRSPASRGFSCSGSTDRCNPGSTRPGSSTSSSRSTDHTIRLVIPCRRDRGADRHPAATGGTEHASASSPNQQTPAPLPDRVPAVVSSRPPGCRVCPALQQCPRRNDRVSVRAIVGKAQERTTARATERACGGCFAASAPP